MFCRWEGNRRSGIALAMNHRLKWCSNLWVQGLSKEDENTIKTPRGVWHRYSLPLRWPHSHIMFIYCTKILNLDANVKHILLIIMFFSKHRLRAINQKYQSIFCSPLKLQHEHSQRVFYKYVSKQSNLHTIN